MFLSVLDCRMMNIVVNDYLAPKFNLMRLLYDYSILRPLFKTDTWYILLRIILTNRLHLVPKEITLQSLVYTGKYFLS